MLSSPNVSTRVMAAYTRMLADYRYGSEGNPSQSDHSDLAQWTETDAVAIWHGYRYGVKDVSPKGQGFKIETFQNRELSFDMTVQMAGGPGKEDSMRGSLPYFQRYFKR